MLPRRVDYKTPLVGLVGLNVPSLNQRGAALPLLPLPAPALPQPRRLAQGVRSCEQLPKYLEADGVKQLDEKTVISMVHEHCRSPTGAYSYYFTTRPSLLSLLISPPR